MPTQPRPQSRPPGSRNVSLADALALASLRPDVQFQWVPNTTTQVRVLPVQTGSGDILLRVPYRSVNDDREAAGFRVVTVPAGWVIQLTQAGIDLPGKVGGRIDGTAAGAGNIGAATNYRAWALIDPWASDGDCFKGIGVTADPTATGAAVSGSIALGASGVITVGAVAPTFTIGARCIVRASAAAGAVWNQVTILSATATTLTVGADATWLGTAENNVALTGTVDVIQVDRFEPRIITGASTGENYPGGGAQPHAWAYLGHLQTNGARLVRMIRQWGDWHVPVTPLTVFTAVGGAGAPASFALGRWLPLGSERAQFTINDSSAGEGFVTIGVDTLIESRTSVSAAARGGGWALASLFRDGLVNIGRTTISGNPTYTVQLVGWRPPTPW